MVTQSIVLPQTIHMWLLLFCRVWRGTRGHGLPPAKAALQILWVREQQEQKWLSQHRRRQQRLHLLGLLGTSKRSSAEQACWTGGKCAGLWKQRTHRDPIGMTSLFLPEPFASWKLSSSLQRCCALTMFSLTVTRRFLRKNLKTENSIAV
jgi:hypothetical protein